MMHHSAVNDSKIAFVAADFDTAQMALHDLLETYPHVEPDEADIIVALGGDGFVLQTLRRFVDE